MIRKKWRGGEPVLSVETEDEFWKAVTGRMKSDYMYSVGVVYNTFPTPPGFARDNADFSALEPLAQAVLDARAGHQGTTLADLYDPDLMPPNLRRAHHALDRAVDRLYRRARFTSERGGPGKLDHLLRWLRPESERMRSHGKTKEFLSSV